MTGHHAFDELAVGWALHALEPEEEEAFARHLAGCQRCTRTVADTSEAMAAMARDLPAAEPSPELRSRLRAAVEATEQLPPPASTQEPTSAVAAPPVPPVHAPAPEAPPAGRRTLTRALVAAAVAAVLGLGTWNAVLSQSRDELRSTVTAQEAVVEELTKAGAATVTPLMAGERQVATVVVRDDGVHVVTDGLARNDRSSSTYVVWGMGDGAPVPLGTFDVAGPQIGVRTVGSPATGSDGFTGYGISLEPGRQAPSSPTEVVATGQVTS